MMLLSACIRRRGQTLIHDRGADTPAFLDYLDLRYTNRINNNDIQQTNRAQAVMPHQYKDIWIII